MSTFYHSFKNSIDPLNLKRNEPPRKDNVSNYISFVPDVEFVGCIFYLFSVTNFNDDEELTYLSCRPDVCLFVCLFVAHLY